MNSTHERDTMDSCSESPAEPTEHGGTATGNQEPEDPSEANVTHGSGGGSEG